MKHFKHLDILLEKIDFFGININPGKCTFGVEKMIFFDLLFQLKDYLFQRKKKRMH